MIDKVVEQLSILRQKCKDGRVSVLVGSGFSKNVSNIFPSWYELLNDMTADLYDEEIDASYLRYLSIHPMVKMDREVFARQEIPRVIARKGPLKVVSEFIARSGFRETIENYIEERIPYIDKENNEFRFVGKNHDKSEAINPDSLAAHSRLLNSRWQRVYTTNYDRLLEFVSDSEGKGYQSVTNAGKLAVYSNKEYIIKLHGDLQHPFEPRSFCFDSNPHQQYVISEEDYKNYPQEHEAFTQLMRISLLQGVFCLIGFSGEDPNFLNWIEWVRDVIVREASNTSDKDEKEKDYKIYLIDISSDLPALGKALFYENHSIFYIPLRKAEVIEFIGASPDDSTRDLFCRFFDYLNPDKNVTRGGDGIDEAEKELKEKREYLTLWNYVFETKITGTLPSFSNSLTVDDEKLRRLLEIKIWNRFVKYSDQQRYYLRQIARQDRLTRQEALLAILALQDTGLPVEQKLIELVTSAGIDASYLSVFQRITQRSKSLFGCEDDDESGLGYDVVLRRLFSLDFKGASDALEHWRPSGPDVMKKAMLLSFFLKDGARESLISYIDSEPNPKERFYATQLLNMVEGAHPPIHSTARYINDNVQDYFELLSNYVRRVTEKNEKVGRYGDGKNQKILWMDGKPTKEDDAIAVLNFLIEAPGFVTFRNFYSIIDSGKWYLVHKALFEKYPYPTLFYSIQCTDKKVQARIGQDYAYSDILLETDLGSILINLLKAFLSHETPHYLKESILTISKEFFVSVSSSKWERLFMKIWDDVVIPSRFEEVNKRDNETLDAFIYRGLNSLTNVLYRGRVIEDVLANAKKDTGFVINCLYYLHVKKTDQNDAIEQDVESFIGQMVEPEEITIAGNVSRILTKEQKERLKEKCTDILQHNLGMKVDEVVFRTARIILKDNDEKRKVFIDSVRNSPLLWKNGILDSGGLSSFSFLKVTNLVRGIYVDQESLLYLYGKMRTSLSELEGFFAKHKSFPAFGDIDGLVAEMVSFMNYFRKRLNGQSDYVIVYNRALALYQRVSGVTSIIDGLFSPYEDNLRDTLNFIYVNRETLSHNEFMEYVDIMIDRVLMKNSDGLDVCVLYLSLFLKESLIGKDDELQLRGLVNILDRFKKQDAQDCNMEVVLTTNELSYMASVLSRYGLSSSGIDYWIEFKKSGRFKTNSSE